MPLIVRTLQGDEGDLLKSLFVTMTTETPTAFAGSLAELERRSNESWRTLAGDIAASPNMEGFIGETEAEICGFVTGAVLTLARLASFEGKNASENGDALSDTTILGRMWVVPHARGQGYGQTLIQAVLN